MSIVNSPNLIDLDKITNKHLTTIAGNSNYKGYSIGILFKALYCNI
ncbi:hypothetical protein THERMOS_641 [Bathymodiolus thermophilus thioautotrophic gill symbiont]|uniref:Uncharacterized protein n=1 Tax=Bathymodiolus thermophilus thioautotrophic gill symbiont TaxID=2360 RepID=A0A8H9CF72_9GAMM|nr:hypothetical protein THERMOS_641 [Bathymodiolus thermophilus thioautotrophic gill symbiont]